MTPHPTRRILPELLTRAGASSRRDNGPTRRVVRTRVRKTHPGRRDHDVAAAAPRTLPKTATRGVSKVEAPLELPRAVGRVKRPRRRRAGDPATRRDASSASPAHVELSNASTASSSSQYAPSEAMSSPARMQQERSVVLVLVSLHAVAVAALIIKFSRSLQSASAAAERHAAHRCPGPDVVCVYQPLVRRTSYGDEKRCHEVLRQPAGASSAELDVFLW